MIEYRIARKTIALVAVLVPLNYTLPASALSMKECSVKYKAAQAAGQAAGVSWNDFRKANCASDAAKTPTAAAETDAQPSDATAAEEPVAKPKKSPKKTDTTATLNSGKATYPSSVAAKFASETPAKARMHTCLEQYHANKEKGTLGGLRWIQQGGGYYSTCNARLKGN
ncbi:hypothetical protein SAMN04515648_0266 [Phyllobacterium sp. CL33Tsu]|uniref:hypothetical protein n=1 Tax=Phyllobacterium sp. CL33Tsu TaxID=1798191 RepID=UPI0008E1A5FA|nr:hypothetical protein [Phyllobacterium sp. CL33Tsu]SFI51640.1 hypothetical protein SAMN04515648_0266 [Phyllobacterium sp. CL33Tsu]